MARVPTEMGHGAKHLPDVDVAAAGGWKTVQTLKSAYQQADADTMLRVVLEAGGLPQAR